MANPRYLTKSRFKLAAECPTKLFYTGKDKVYRNTKQEDSFLAMLAEGGYQVGELATRESRSFRACDSIRRSFCTGRHPG